jgi:hypothetical protein
MTFNTQNWAFYKESLIFICRVTPQSQLIHSHLRWSNYNWFFIVFFNLIYRHFMWNPFLTDIKKISEPERHPTSSLSQTAKMQEMELLLGWKIKCSKGEFFFHDSAFSSIWAYNNSFVKDSELSKLCLTSNNLTGTWTLPSPPRMTRSTKVTVTFPPSDTLPMKKI